MGFIRNIFKKKTTTPNTSQQARDELQRAIDISKGTTPAPTGASELQRAIDKSTTTISSGRTSGGGSSYTAPTTGVILTTGVTPSTFSGKVEQIGVGGKVESTEYIKENKTVGRLFSVKGEKYAETSKGVKSASFTFDTQGGTKREVVELGGETGGARISEYEMMIGETRPGIQEDVLVGGGEEFMYGTISPAPTGFLQGMKEQKSIISTQLMRGEDVGIVGRGKLLGLTIGTTVVGNVLGLYQLGKGLVTKPVETIKGFPGGIKTTVSEFGTTLRSGSPEEIIGRVGGEYLTFKGISGTPKIITKGVDIFRTSNLRELPVVKPGDISFVRRGRDVFFERELTGQFKKQKFEIIAPEYFEGQPYPLIKKGETAGQLLKEFKPLLPGEKAPAGYTASPKPFAKETIVEPGSSELKMLYQAPRVSPKFLKISSEEQKGFSLNPFDTFRPSVERTTPKNFELTPLLKYSQKEIASLSKTKEFIEIAPKGKSYITFVKREKEAGIPFETPIIRTDKRFYFKFEGRRIPILEQKTVEIIDNINIKEGKLSTAKEISSSLSYRRLGSKGKYSSSDVLGSYRMNILSSSNIPSLRSSFSSSVSSIRKGLSSTNYYGRTGGRSYGFGYSGRSSGGGYPTGFGGGSSYGGGGSYSPPYIPPTKVWGKLPQLKLPKSQGLIRGERLFLPTTSFGVSLGKQIGLDVKAFSQKGGLAQTGLTERKWGTTRLPTTVLWKTQTKEFKTFPKIKSYLKSVI